MDGKTASLVTGLSYGQLNYLIRTIPSLLSTPRENDRHARNFTYREVVLLRLARVLKNDHFRIQSIKQALEVVNENWCDNDPDSASVLIYSAKSKRFAWATPAELELIKTESAASLLSKMPGNFYFIGAIAREMQRYF